MIYVLARRCLEKTSKVSLMRFLFSVPICPLCKSASLSGSSSGVLLAEGVRPGRPSSRSGSATSQVTKRFLTALKRKSHQCNQCIALPKCDNLLVVVVGLYLRYTQIVTQIPPAAKRTPNTPKTRERILSVETRRFLAK